MSKIILKSVAVENFGGIANGTYFFDTLHDSVIVGASGNGKSSCYLAYLWALGFNVNGWETLINGYRLHKKDTKVEIVIQDKETKLEYKIAKVNKPKYKIDKFTAEEQYNGNDYKYYIDDIETPQKEFVAQIEKIFGIEYLTLELLTNITMFNNEESTRWNKDLRRKFLLDIFENQISGEMQDVSNDEKMQPIKDFLLKGYSEFQIGESIKSLKSANKKEIDLINGSLAEKQNDLTMFNDIDFDLLIAQKDTLEKQIKDLQNNAKQNNIESKISAVKEEMHKQEIESKEYEYKSKLEIDNVNSEKATYETEYNNLKDKMETNTITLENVQYAINDELNSVYIAKDKCCPICKKPFTDSDIELARDHFEQEKTKRINDMVATKEKIIADINDNEICLAEIETKIKDLEKKHLQKTQETNDKKVEMENKWLELNNQLESLLAQKQADTTEQHFADLTAQLNDTERQLAKKELYTATLTRIEELKSKLRELGMEETRIALMKQALNAYNDTKNALIDKCMKENFVRVRYNFKQWLKSQSGKDYEDNYRPICTCTLDDIEYGSLSSGQQVVADILTSLSLRKLLNIDIPQFIDDVVLASLITKQETNGEIKYIADTNIDWQRIYLVTESGEDIKIYNANENYNKNEENVKQKITKINKIYTINDCDIR